MADQTDRPIEHTDNVINVLQTGPERNIGRIRTIGTVAGKIDGVGYQARSLEIRRETRPSPRPLPCTMN
jgi:hypothetical protein